MRISLTNEIPPFCDFFVYFVLRLFWTNKTFQLRYLLSNANFDCHVVAWPLPMPSSILSLILLAYPMFLRSFSEIFLHLTYSPLVL